MIKCNFHTNLDLCFGDKGGWPDQLLFRPVVGDYIRSTFVHTGRYDYSDPSTRDDPPIVGKGYQLELVVVRVMIVSQNQERWGTGQFKYLDVELHLPSSRYQSLRDFYNWYEKITGQKFI